MWPTTQAVCRRRWIISARILIVSKSSRRVFSDFIAGDKKGLAGRSSDLIGLVTFARYADTTCPLVLSHNVLLEFLKKTEIVNLRSGEDGTAIGDAIALAAARLKTAEEEFQQRKARLIKAGEKT